MRIAVMGAGAIGCFLAARLEERGHTITLVGRPAQVEAINRDGLLVREHSGRERQYRLRAETQLDETPELILLAVKTQDVATACKELAPWAAGVPVVAMQNGLEAERIAADVLGRESVLGAVVMCSVTYVQVGEITVHFTGWMLLGEPFAQVSARTHRVARVLREAGPTYITRDMRRARWTKLVTNLNNGICAATGLTLPELGSSEQGRVLSVRVMKEGYRVARANGVHLDHGLYGLTPRSLGRDPNATVIALLQGTMSALLAVAPERVAEGVLKAAGRSRLNQLPMRFSTWQSIARGQPTEIEYLNGAVVDAGKKLGVETPYNARVVEMVRRAEQTHTFCTVDALFPQGSRLPQAVAAGGDRS